MIERDATEPTHVPQSELAAFVFMVWTIGMWAMTVLFAAIVLLGVLLSIPTWLGLK